MEDAGQGEVLAVLRRWWRDALALTGLTEWVLLLGWWALISLRVGLGRRHLERAEHGDLDCLWMVNVGRALVVVLGIDILGVVSTVELVKHVALLGSGEGILRVLLALLRVLLRRLLCRVLEVQKESGCGEHRHGRRAEYKQPTLFTTSATTTTATEKKKKTRERKKKTALQNLGYTR